MSSLSWLGYVRSWFQFDPLNIPSYTVPLLSTTSPSYEEYEEYDDDESNDDEDDDSRPPINKKVSHPVQTQAPSQKGGRVRTKFGQRVLWLERSHGGYHLPAHELEHYRTRGDRPIDRIVHLLRDEKTTTNHGDGSGNGLGPGDDLLEMMKQATEKIKRIQKKKKKQPQPQHNISTTISRSTSTTTATATVSTISISTADLEMASFYHSVSTLPPWVEIEQLRRGQEVYLAYLPAISMSLYYRSLIAGFSIPKIAAVIRATAYLAPPSRPDQVMQRLLDTGEFTACIGGGLGVEALLPGGLGWKTALHVRFLHAKVRFAILHKNQKKNKQSSSRSWNVAELGVPINQEDMAATLLAFSTNVLMGVSLLAGRAVSEREQRDYLALWRYVGWLLGVETDHTVGVIVEVESSTASSTTAPIESESDNDDGETNDNSNDNNNRSNNRNSNGITVGIVGSATPSSSLTTESESDNGNCDTNDKCIKNSNSNGITVRVIGSLTSSSSTTTESESESESDNDDCVTNDNSNENNTRNSNNNGITVGVIRSSTSRTRTESESDNDNCETNDKSNTNNNSNSNSIGTNDTTNNKDTMVLITTERLHHPLTVPEDLFELPPLDPCGPGNAQFVRHPDVIDNSSGMFSSMIFHLLEPDDSSKEVAHHLLRACVRTSPFYFRAMNCRRMIGKDLADALKLPYHPNKWTRRRIWMFSTIELLLVRIYTLIPMYLPCFVRQRMVQWHTQALHAFHEQWMKTHHSKMARAMQRKELPSVLDDNNNNKKKKKNVDATTTEDVNDTTTDATTATHSVCPFAMMAKPE